MAYKVTNISRRVVGLNLGEGSNIEQRNLQSGEFIVLDELTPQVKALADPYRRVLQVAKVSVVSPETGSEEVSE